MIHCPQHVEWKSLFVCLYHGPPWPHRLRVRLTGSSTTCYGTVSVGLVRTMQPPRAVVHVRNVAFGIAVASNSQS